MSDQPRASKTKVGKTVRIISPHSATSKRENERPDGFFASTRPFPSSPPPVSPPPEASDEGYPEDPFSADSDRGGSSTDDENTHQNTLTNSGGQQANVQGSTGVPKNPFKKTLARLGVESNLSLSSPNNELMPAGAEAASVRPHYDVDDFKRLLMTGERSNTETIPPTVPPVTFQGQHNVGDSSSNTDASSISRHSILESVSATLQESPGTSNEGSPSDDEQQLGGSQFTNIGRNKPAAPQHRHGKPVKTNAPQTVSFEDPSLFLTSSAISTLSLGQLSRDAPGSPGDLDKQLPPLPATLVLQQKSNDLALVNDSTQHQLLEPEDVQARDTSQKRNPPAPPLTRRHSKFRPKSFANGSERTTPLSEENPIESVPLSHSPPAMMLKPPPPPPPRRSGLVRSDSQSSTTTSAAIRKLHGYPNTEEASSAPSKSRAPVPPNCSPSISAIKRPNQGPAVPGSTSIAPPVPPRRRGSSQSSYAPYRLSGDYRAMATERMRSDSGASSISQLHITSPVPSTTESKDVMADLSALQREVDELREKIGN